MRQLANAPTGHQRRISGWALDCCKAPSQPLMPGTSTSRASDGQWSSHRVPTYPTCAKAHNVIMFIIMLPMDINESILHLNLIPENCREVALRVEIDLAESGHTATCGHALAWNSLEQPLAATCGHLRPLAATCGRSLGNVWSGHLRPLAATRGHSLGTVWGGHLRPLAATRLEQSGAATCGHSLGTVWSGHLRPLAATRLEQSGAATCGHLRPLAWKCLERPLAITCLELSGAATCGHLRPLARKCLERPLAATSLGQSEAATCGHLRPFAVTSGCKLLPCT